MIIGLCVFLRTSQPSWLPVKFPPSYSKGEELTEGGRAYWKGWSLLKGASSMDQGWRWSLFQFCIYRLGTCLWAVLIKSPPWYLVILQLHELLRGGGTGNEAIKLLFCKKKCIHTMALLWPYIVQGHTRPWDPLYGEFHTYSPASTNTHVSYSILVSCNLIVYCHAFR